MAQRKPAGVDSIDETYSHCICKFFLLLSQIPGAKCRQEPTNSKFRFADRENRSPAAFSRAVSGRHRRSPSENPVCRIVRGAEKKKLPGFNLRDGLPAGRARIDRSHGGMHVAYEIRPDRPVPTAHGARFLIIEFNHASFEEYGVLTPRCDE